MTRQPNLMKTISISTMVPKKKAGQKGKRRLQVENLAKSRRLQQHLGMEGRSPSLLLPNNANREKRKRKSLLMCLIVS